MVAVAERKDALLGARLLFVAARSAECAVELVLGERLLQTVGLHDVGVLLAAEVEGVHPHRDAILVDVLDQLALEIGLDLVAVPIHVLELPGRVDVQQREGQGARRERLLRQAKHDRGVLPDRVHHDRVVELRRGLADDLNALRFELAELA